jgi:carbon-monoxide dehydrogenase small subunit
LIDGDPVRSCLTLALTAAGKDVLTIEGLAKNGKLHPIQKAFMENGAFQCGFCTPAMVLVAKALLDKNPHPTRHDVVYYMSGNLCRCGCYEEIVDAVLAVANGKVKEA